MSLALPDTSARRRTSFFNTRSHLDLLLSPILSRRVVAAALLLAVICGLGAITWIGSEEAANSLWANNFLRASLALVAFAVVARFVSEKYAQAIGWVVFAVPLGLTLNLLAMSGNAAYTASVMALMLTYALIGPSQLPFLIYLGTALMGWAVAIQFGEVGAWRYALVPFIGSGLIAAWIRSHRQQVFTPILQDVPSLDHQLNQAEAIRHAHSLATACEDWARNSEAACKDAEERLEQYSQRLKTVLDQTRSIHFILDNKGQILKAEGAGQALFGLAAGTLPGRNLLKLLKHRPTAQAMLQRSLKGERLTTSFRLGKEIVSLEAMPTFHNHSGEVHQLLGHASIITDSEVAKEKSSQVIELRKLVSDHLANLDSKQQQLLTLRSETEGLKKTRQLQETDIIRLQKQQTQLQESIAKLTTERDQLKDELEEWPRLTESIKVELNSDWQKKLQLAEVKQKDAEAKKRELDVKLQQAEKDRVAAELAWHTTEEQLKTSEQSRKRAEEFALLAESEQSRIETSYNRLRLAVDELPQPFLLLDTAGRIAYENRSARSWHDDSLVNPIDHPLLASETLRGEGMNTARREGGWNKQLSITDQQGKKVQVQCQLVPVQDRGKDFAGFVVLFEPLDSRHKLETKLQGLADGIDSKSRAMPKFAQRLVDLLEPPLSKLLKSSDKLLEPMLSDDARRQSLLNIQNQGSYLNSLLQQATDYAALESDDSLLVHNHFSPWQQLQAVVQEFDEAARARGVEIQLNTGTKLPETIHSDANRFHQIARHMLGLAVRRTHSGSINISLILDAPSSGKGTSLLSLEVEDSGIPLTSQQASDLLQPFLDANSPTDFGLSLAQKRATALGGEILCQHQPGLGLRTILQLPLEPADLGKLIPAAELPILDRSPSNITGPLQGKVLLVVDGQDIQRSMTFHLERMGLRVTVSGDSKHALNEARGEHYDAILWDSLKAGMPAAAAVRELRQSNYAGPVLAVLEDVHGKDHFLQSGGDGVLLRTMLPASWKATLQSVLPMNAEMVNHYPAENRLAIQSGYHQDREFMPLVTSFVDRLPAQLAEIRAAQQVADIAQLATLAQKLEEAAQMFGYPTLVSAIERLQHCVMNGKDSATLTKAIDGIESISKDIRHGLEVRPVAEPYLHTESIIRAA